MNKLLIAIISIGLLASCSKKKQMVYENDTDNHDWMNQQRIVDVPNAHSGKSVCKIDSVNPYGLGFCKTIENISPNKFKEIHFSYWVLAKSEKAKGNTVLSIDFNGKNINWEGRPLIINELNKWVEINETFKLPDVAKFNNQLSLYTWNTSKEEILIDDLKITFK